MSGWSLEFLLCSRMEPRLRGCVSVGTNLKLLHVCQVCLVCEWLCQDGDLHIGIQLSQFAGTRFHSEISAKKIINK